MRMRGDALPGSPSEGEGAQAARRRGSIRWPLAVTGVVLGASAFLSAPPATASAALTVCASGCGFTSVQAAIDAAPGGDTIIVEAGSYDGPLTAGKNLTLRGAGAARTTLRAGAGGGPVLTVDPGVTVTVTGVTISGGSGPAGGGIRNERGAALTIKDSAISHNSASELGGGIFNGPGATLAITDSSLTGNTAIYGGAIRNETGATLTIKDSAISGNTAAGTGGGVYNLGHAALADSSMADNTAAYGGGAIVNPGGSVSLASTTINGNRSLYAGAGGIGNNGIMAIADSTVSDNHALSDGGGIFNNPAGALTLSNTVVAGNSADSDGGGIYNRGHATLTDSRVSDNSALSDGGGIYLASGAITLQNSAITGNAPDNCAPPGSISGCSS